MGCTNSIILSETGRVEEWNNSGYWKLDKSIIRKPFYWCHHKKHSTVNTIWGGKCDRKRIKGLGSNLDIS